MPSTSIKRHTLRKILIGVLIFIVLLAAAFHIFITRYLPPIVKKRLAEVVVNGSDSLYRFEMGKFDLSFWGGSARFEDLAITIDSNVYRRMSERKILPPLTASLILKKGHINGIGLTKLLFSKKLDIREIVFDSADVELARHFKNSDDAKMETDSTVPLWKTIQPRLKAIRIGNMYAADLRISYRNVDSAAAFRWKIEKSNILFTDIRVDSLSTLDTNRLLFARDISFKSSDVKLKTGDGLYFMQAGDVSYASGDRSLQINRFEFVPAVSAGEFNKHFGYQHEIYSLKIPAIRVLNFVLPRWVTQNRLLADQVELSSPAISISLDRNQPPNTKSKLGNYPHQLLQKAGFLIQINRLKATDASFTYKETNNVTNMTGTLVFPSLAGTIENITNDPVIISRRPDCIATIGGSVMKTGRINSVFRFHLNDRSGGFRVNATITNLNAAQLQPLFKAMTAVDMQSFDLQRIDYVVNGNELAATGNLSMRYSNMDILINKVTDDKTFDKKGFLSFLANRLIIYPDNPHKDDPERTASNKVVQRDVTRSFFNLIWKTMFSAAGDIVLRPLAQRRMEKKQERAARKEARVERRQERNNRSKN